MRSFAHPATHSATARPEQGRGTRRQTNRNLYNKPALNKSPFFQIANSIQRFFQIRLNQYKDNVKYDSAGGRNHPDIIIVQPLNAAQTKWKIHAVEVISPGQTEEELLPPLDAAFASLNKHGGNIEHGSFRAVENQEYPMIKW